MQLRFDQQGLITTVVQDRISGQVRMVAWMNQEALEATRRTGLLTFYSRSRRALWVKGETSGHQLRLQRLVADCDGDTLLALVDPVGPSCHTGRQSCFFEALEPERADALEPQPAPALFELGDVVHSRATSTANKSYTKSLLEGGASAIGAKVEEEAGEFAAALRDEPDDRVVSEAADVLYHLLVGLESRGLGLDQVGRVLAGRMGVSGLVEKAQRDPAT